MIQRMSINDYEKIFDLWNGIDGSGYNIAADTKGTLLWNSDDHAGIILP